MSLTKQFLEDLHAIEIDNEDQHRRYISEEEWQEYDSSPQNWGQ